MDNWSKLETEFGEALQKNVPMSELTTTEIGGPAKYFFDAKTQDNLIKILEFVTENQIPYLVIGGGSNLLVNDQGIDQLVIKNSTHGIVQNNQTLTVQAGTSLQEFVDYTIEHGLSGAHKLTGVPGTVGGAVYGNAGAYGQTISDHLTQIVVFKDHRTQALSKSDCGFAYRHSDLKNTHDPILEIIFEFPSVDSETLKTESADVLEKRLKKYPTGVKCPGSFFKNLLVEDIPPQILETIPNVKDYYGKVPSWYFLEEVGAKGDTQGQVEIADFHANLFINKGGGTAQDFYDLAHKYALKVREKFHITLEPEVQLINLPPVI